MAALGNLHAARSLVGHRRGAGKKPYRFNSVLPVTSSSPAPPHSLITSEELSREPLEPGEVRIPLSVRYQSGQAPEDEEWSPILVAYLPNTFQRVAQTAALPENDQNQIVELNVCGLHSTESEVKQDTRINFQVYTTQMNKYGAPCYVDSGSASVPLYDISRSVSKARQKGSPGSVIEVELPTLMHVASDFPKGMLYVSVDTARAELGSGLKWEQNPMPTEDIVKRAQINERNMYQYAKSAMMISDQIPLTYHATKNIRCPFYPSECSPIDGAMALPAFSYMMYETPPSDPEFFQLAIGNVMNRLPGSPAPSEYTTMSPKEQASLMVKVCCHMPQGFDYVSDTINMKSRRATLRYNSLAESKKPVENFGDSLQTYSGDCEDDANAICQIHTALLECPIQEGVHSRHLVELKKMARRYVPVMTLAGVTSSHIQNDVKGSKAQKGVKQYKSLGAHMAVTFLPLRYHNQCLARGGCKVPPGAMGRGDPVDDELEVLIGEGTGMFDPAGAPDPVPHERAYTCYPFDPSSGAHECMRLIKKPIHHSRSEESSFYKVAKVGWERMSDGTARGLKYAKCKVMPGRHRGELHCVIVSIGVSYQDLWNMRENVALLPHPKPSASLMESIRSVVANRVPVRPLYGFLMEEEGPPGCPGRKNLEKLQNHLMKEGREGVKSRLRTKTNVVSAYGPAHCFSDEWLQMAKEHMSNAEWVRAVDWECESCTNDYYLYKMNMHVVPPEVANRKLEERRRGFVMDEMRQGLSGALASPRYSPGSAYGISDLME